MSEQELKGFPPSTQELIDDMLIPCQLDNIESMICEVLAILKKPKRTNKRACNEAHRFDDWWKAYPKKVGKKAARTIWKRRNLDIIADTIIIDTMERPVVCEKWKAGFIPNPTTYLNGDRWEDDYETNRRTQGGNGQRETPVQRSERIEREELAKSGIHY